MKKYYKKFLKLLETTALIDSGELFFSVLLGLFSQQRNYFGNNSHHKTLKQVLKNGGFGHVI